MVTAIFGPRRQRRGAGDDVGEAAPDQRLSAGEAHLVDSEVVYADRDQPDDLVVGEHLVGRQPVETLGRHAVRTAQIAPVGQRHAQVSADSTVLVEQGEDSVVWAAHSPSLRVRSQRSDKLAVPCSAFSSPDAGSGSSWLSSSSASAASSWASGSSIATATASPTTRSPRPTWPPTRSPVGEVMSVGRPARAEPTNGAWSRQPAATTPASRLLVLYRTREGSPGVDVVVPLVTDDGTALLVDRGWVQTEGGSDNLDPDVPDAPTGTVTVQGWVRRNATGGDNQTVPTTARCERSRRTRSAPTLPYPVYDGFVDLTDEDPDTSRSADQGRAARPRIGPAFLLRPAVVLLRFARVRLLVLFRLGRMGQTTQRNWTRWSNQCRRG